MCFTTRVICICMDSSSVYVCFSQNRWFFPLFCPSSSSVADVVVLLFLPFVLLFTCLLVCHHLWWLLLLFVSVHFASNMRTVMWKTIHCHLAIAYNVCRTREHIVRSKNAHTIHTIIILLCHYDILEQNTRTIVSCNANAQTNKIKLFLNFFLCRLQHVSVCFQQAWIYVLNKKREEKNSLSRAQALCTTSFAVFLSFHSIHLYLIFVPFRGFCIYNFPNMILQDDDGEVFFLASSSSSHLRWYWLTNFEQYKHKKVSEENWIKIKWFSIAAARCFFVLFREPVDGVL